MVHRLLYVVLHPAVKEIGQERKANVRDARVQVSIELPETGLSGRPKTSTPGRISRFRGQPTQQTNGVRRWLGAKAVTPHRVPPYASLFGCGVDPAVRKQRHGRI